MPGTRPPRRSRFAACFREPSRRSNSSVTISMMTFHPFGSELEEGADRLLLVNAENRFRQNVRDREHGDLLRTRAPERDGVRHDELPDRRLVDLRVRVAGEDAVRADRVDLPRP